MLNRIESWFYGDVPGLRSVSITPEAMRSLERDHVTQQELEETLEYGTDTKDWSVPHGGYREHNGVRLTFRTEHQHRMKNAAAVCIDGYRVKP